MPPRLMDSAAATGRAVGAIIDCLASLTGRFRAAAGLAR